MSFGTPENDLKEDGHKKNYPEVKWIEVPIANFTNIMVGRENFKLKIRFLGFVLQKHFDQFQ